MLRFVSSNRKAAGAPTAANGPGAAAKMPVLPDPAAPAHDPANTVRVPTAPHFVRKPSANEPQPGDHASAGCARRLVKQVSGISLDAHIDVYALPVGLETDVLWVSDRLPREGEGHYPFAETRLITIDPSVDVPAGADGGRANIVKATANADAASHAATGPAASEAASRTDGASDPATNSAVSHSTSSASAIPDIHDLASNLIFQGEDFEMRVAGMSVSAFDSALSALDYENELILYSTEFEKTSSATATIESPPFVHFDYKKEKAVRPDQYQPISDSTSLVLRCHGTTESSDSVASGNISAPPVQQPRQNINVCFKIIEMEKAPPVVRSTINGISALGPALAGLGSVIPYLAVVSPAVSLAGKIGKSALDAFGAAKKALQIDVGFRIMAPGAAPTLRTGEFLAYGWYFFLAKPTRAKLYAATSTTRSVRLMMKQNNPDKFVPLTHVTYLVVRVCQTHDPSDARGQGLTADQAMRLQQVVENAHVTDANKLKEDIVQIIRGSGSPFATAADAVLANLPSDAASRTVTQKSANAPPSEGSTVVDTAREF